MTVLNPVQCFINTFSGKGANGQSSFITFSFSNTSGFDAEVPIKILGPASVSAGAEVYLHRSQDGGANYETERTPAAAFTRAGGATQIKTAIIPNGQFLVSVLVGGGSSATWSVDFGATCRLITAYQAL